MARLVTMTVRTFFHIVGDGEPEKEHQDNWHAEEHQHGALVSNDVFGLFDDQ